MAQDELRSQIAERYQLLHSSKWPRGASAIPGLGDADVDLAELEGFVSGLASSYVQKASLRADRIALSRHLAETFERSLESEEQDKLLQPYRRVWRLIVELSELLAKTGKIRVEWTE
jgi:hypothetical protein